MSNYVLAIDQGTTSSRAILFDETYVPVATAQKEFNQHFPQSGWVEHDPEDIWETTLSMCREAIAGRHGRRNRGHRHHQPTRNNCRLGPGKWQAPSPGHRVAGPAHRRCLCGIEKCRTRTQGRCANRIVARPYFSGTKVAWILDNVDGARDAANAGRLAFGTIDTFLLWRLTGGKVHATDATNASRTLLYDIHEGRWSSEMCDLFRVPMSVLPEVMDCADDYGETATDLFGGPILIGGVAGDQQAATVGQACFQPGMMKATYGTGCFALLNTGQAAVASTNRLLTTIAYQLGGQPTYALEGSIFIAGSAVQWLRDG